MDVGELLSQEDMLQLISLSEIFGGFSHEIAQPLNAIMIASQVIQLRLQRSFLPDDEKSFLIHRLGIVSSQVQRATQIVEAVRRFSRINVPDSGDSDIKAAFENVYGLMAQQFVGRGVELAWESQDPLPPLGTASHLTELILVQGMAFARTSVEAIGEWHAEKGISYGKHVKVKLAPGDEGSLALITWNGGQLGDRSDLIDSSTDPGFVAARSALTSFGGDIQTSANTLSLTFP